MTNTSPDRPPALRAGAAPSALGRRTRFDRHCAEILAQTAEGHSPEIVLEAMKASGWEEAVARIALAGTLGEKAAGVASAPSRPLPGCAIDATRPRLRAGDRDVAVLIAMSHPRVVVFGDLLSAEECAELIELARKRLSRSETVATRTGTSEINEARTSDGMFFQPGEFPVCARLETCQPSTRG